MINDIEGLPISVTERQKKLVGELTTDVREGRLATTSVAVLNYDNGVLLDPERYGIGNLLKPLFDWYRDQTLFIPFNLMQSVISLERIAIESKVKGANDLNIWEAVVNVASDCIKQLPEDERKEQLWMSIYGDYPGIGEDLIQTATACNIIPSRELYDYLRRNLQKEHKEGRIGNLGMRELGTLNRFETSAASEFVSLMTYEVLKLRNKRNAESDSEGVTRLENLLHSLGFYSPRLVLATLEASGNSATFGRYPQKWDVAFGAILIAAYAALDSAETYRVQRSELGLSNKQTATILEKENSFMKDYKELKDMRRIFLDSWNWYSQALFSFNKSPIRPFIHRVINRFVNIDAMVTGILQS